MDRLTCEQAFRSLDDYLDRELESEEIERMRAHLEVSEACAREYEFQGSVLHAVRTS